MSQNRSTAVMQRRVEAHGLPFTRKDARESGVRHYFTGRPCIRGHIAARTVADKKCIECNRVRCSQYRSDTIEARREYDNLRYRQPDRKAAAFAQAKRWRKANPGKVNHITASRRAWIKLATPHWLTTEHKAEIRGFYATAASFGPGMMHVDHIVPLRGAHVCGLHVPWNLRVIPSKLNIAKGNR